MIHKMELIYKSPNSMKKPAGALTFLEINGFQGKREYVIRADLELNIIGSKDSSLFLRVNGDGIGDSYSSIEHIYGRFNGQTIHMTNFRPAGVHGGLFMARTHANKKSTINIESKIYSTPSYPKISLQTITPNFIISSHDNWIQEDISSIYNSPNEEIKNMMIYSYPPGKFYGYLKIYRIINE